MEVKEDRVLIHVTEVGGCVRKAILRALGTEETDKYYHAQLGTATHKVCEYVLGQKPIPPLDTAMDVVYDQYYKNDLFWDSAKPEIREKIERLYTWLALEQALGTFDGSLHTERTMMVEIPEMTIHGKPVFLVGTADVIAKGQVIDIKSGKSRSPAHVRQVCFYTDMFTRENVEPLDEPDPKDIVMPRIIYLGAEIKGKVQKNGKEHRYFQRDVDREQYEKVMKSGVVELLNYIDAIDKVYPEVPRSKECPDCFFCPFRSGCFGQQDNQGGMRQ